MLSYQGLKHHTKWAWNISFLSAVFACLIASLGIVIFREGPSFFIFFIGLLAIVPLALYKNEFRTYSITSSPEIVV
jgi:hypothetical protein